MVVVVGGDDDDDDSYIFNIFLPIGQISVTGII